MSIDDMIERIETKYTNASININKVAIPYKDRKLYGLGIRRGLEGQTVRTIAVTIGETGSDGSEEAHRYNHFYDYSVRKAVLKAYVHFFPGEAAQQSNE